MRYSLAQPRDPGSTLIVDTCEVIDDATIARFEHDLESNGCANGILLDPQRCLILRDTFAGTAGSFVLEAELPTETVLSRLGRADHGGLDARVARWLELLSAGWDSALPADRAIRTAFLMDIVPAVSGASVFAWRPSAA